MRFCADQINKKIPKPKIWWLGRKFVARPLIFSEKHWFLPKSVYFVDFHQVRAFSRAETWTCRGVRALDGRSGLITSRNDPQRSPGRNTGGLRALARSLAGVTWSIFFYFSIQNPDTHSPWTCTMAEPKYRESVVYIAALFALGNKVLKKCEFLKPML